LTVELHHGIGGYDNRWSDGARGNQIGFCAGKALYKFVGFLVRIGSLIDSGRKHRKRESGIAQNFRAARRSGSKNKFDGDKLPARILQTLSLRSCAGGQYKFR
jgi:hypothetical protein